MSLEKYSEYDLKKELERRSITAQVEKLEKYLRGRVVTSAPGASEEFVIHDMRKPTHNVSVFDTFVNIRPVPHPIHSFSVSQPDHSAGVSEEYLTSIYIFDTLKIYIAGTRKEGLKIQIVEDEFPVEIELIKYSDNMKITVREEES